jgi:pimeloyl-ACP methyl ester carboxylesterase
MHERVVYFAHGKETGPEAVKIQYLSEIAKAKGCRIESPDYSDLADPDDRVQRLLVLARETLGGLVLVGSSMGAYVSVVASERLKPKGLYLLAPAVSLEGYAIQDPIPRADVAVAVHGWNDEVVPVANVLRFAQRYAVELHLLNADHRLLSVLPLVGRLFELFLDRTPT